MSTAASVKRNRGSGSDGFADDPASTVDRQLVEQAVDGSRAALSALIDRHRQFVFNIAFRMFGTRADADDVTQEIFVRAITSLKTFRQASAFRTWLYRIAVNHCLRTRRRDREKQHESFDDFFDQLATVPDEEPSAALSVTSETVEELRLRCTSGMLMCLDRDQRMTFILGAVFAVPQEIAAEILDVTPGNYRVRLHRARQDLYSWMSARCGLIDPANPCRCHKKTGSFVRQGLVDPKRLVFNTDHLVSVDALTRRGAEDTMERVDEIHQRHEQQFRNQPYHQTRQSVVDDILGDRTLRSFFDLELRPATKAAARRRKPRATGGTPVTRRSERTKKPASGMKGT